MVGAENAKKHHLINSFQQQQQQQHYQEQQHQQHQQLAKDKIQSNLVITNSSGPAKFFHVTEVDILY
jgi:hypothetical protein